jgi:hypothetical protein
MVFDPNFVWNTNGPVKVPLLNCCGDFGVSSPRENEKYLPGFIAIWNLEVTLTSAF